MRPPAPVLVLLVLLAAVLCAAPADAATTEADTTTAPAESLLSPPLARTPVEQRGTVVLLPASGWGSPTLAAQHTIWSRMAPTLYAAGYRVVAIDYQRGGEDGLASVLEAVRTEAKRPRLGPLCLYGESSGGHLALLAANRLTRVDCVVTFGTPVDFTRMQTEVETHPNELGWTSGMQIVRDTFGATAGEWSSWEPANMRTPLRVPTLTMACADDGLIPPSQARALPGAESFVAPAGDPAKPRHGYVHGTISPAGRRAVQRRIVAFVDAAGAPVSARRS